MRLFDSHCHLTDGAFDEDRQDVVARARSAGVVAMVTIASDARDSERTATLADAHTDIWCTAGVHPHESGAASPDALVRVRDLLQGERVVAVGETGLDYHYDHSPRATQRNVFDRHLALAAELDLPAVVHSREAEADTIAAVRSAGPDLRGVLHCFSGTRALLEAGIAADWYFSFGGMVTFKRWDGADLLRAVPADRLLLETDAPYLAPVPRRGRRNEPSFIEHTCRRAAELLAVEPDQLAADTTANAYRFFRIPDPRG